MTADEPNAPPPPADQPQSHVVPPVADGERKALDPRLVSAQRLARGIFSAVVLFATLPGVVVTALVGISRGPAALLPMLGWFALAGLLAWWAWGWPPLAYRYASYVVDRTGIEIRRGVVWRRVINVPRSRVQHTDVSQGPIERSHGIGTLVIYTAGTDFARVRLEGLHHDTALRIRDHLLPDIGPDAV